MMPDTEFDALIERATDAAVFAGSEAVQDLITESRAACIVAAIEAGGETK